MIIGYPQPENPNWYTRRDAYGGVVLEAVTTTEIAGGEATASPTGVLTLPMEIKRSESAGRKGVEMSVGGMMCTFLVVSALILV